MAAGQLPYETHGISTRLGAPVRGVSAVATTHEELLDLITIMFLNPATKVTVSAVKPMVSAVRPTQGIHCVFFIAMRSGANVFFMVKCSGTIFLHDVKLE